MVTLAILNVGRKRIQLSVDHRRSRLVSGDHPFPLDGADDDVLTDGAESGHSKSSVFRIGPVEAGGAIALPNARLQAGIELWKRFEDARSVAVVSGSSREIARKLMNHGSIRWTHMAGEKQEKSAIDKFEESLTVAVLDDRVRDRVNAIVDIWRRYLAEAGKRNLTPREIADTLFTQLAEWTARDERPPHPGLLEEELTDSAVQDDTIRKALDRVELVLTKLGVFCGCGNAPGSKREESFRYRIAGTWHNVTIAGPRQAERGDSDKRIWLRADFNVDDTPVSLGSFELQRGRAPITLTRPAEWCYLSRFGVSFAERIPRLFPPDITLEEMVLTKEAQTSIRGLFATADGYMTAIDARDRPLDCVSHLMSNRGPHRWTDPAPLEIECVFSDGHHSMWLACNTHLHRDESSVWLDAEVTIKPDGLSLPGWLIHLGEHRPPENLVSITLTYLIPRNNAALDLEGSENRDTEFYNRVVGNAALWYAVGSRASQSFTIVLADFDIVISPRTSHRNAYVSFEFRRHSAVSPEELQHQVFSLDFQWLVGRLAFPLGRVPKNNPPP